MMCCRSSAPRGHSPRIAGTTRAKYLGSEVPKRAAKTVWLYSGMLSPGDFERACLAFCIPLRSTGLALKGRE